MLRIIFRFVQWLRSRVVSAVVLQNHFGVTRSRSRRKGIIVDAVHLVNMCVAKNSTFAMPVTVVNAGQFRQKWHPMRVTLSGK